MAEQETAEVFTEGLRAAKQFLWVGSKLVERASTDGPYMLTDTQELCDLLDRYRRFVSSCPFVDRWHLLVCQGPCNLHGYTTATAHRWAWQFGRRIWGTIQSVIFGSQLLQRMETGDERRPWPDGTKGDGSFQLDSEAVFENLNEIRRHLSAVERPQLSMLEACLELEAARGEVEWRKATDNVNAKLLAPDANVARAADDRNESKPTQQDFEDVRQVIKNYGRTDPTQATIQARLKQIEGRGTGMNAVKLGIVLDKLRDEGTYTGPKRSRRSRK